MLRYSSFALVSCLLISTGTYAEQTEIAILNQRHTTLWEFFASPTGYGNWGQDRLGNVTVKPHYSVKLGFYYSSDPDSCYYDFKAVFDDGTSTIDNYVDVCNTGVFSYTE